MFKIGSKVGGPETAAAHKGQKSGQAMACPAQKLPLPMISKALAKSSTIMSTCFYNPNLT